MVTSRVVGYQPHRLRSADFRHFMLQDLDEGQIGNFLDKWHDVTFDKPQEAEPKRQRLDAAIKNSKSIAQLAGNPLLLTMMAILNRNQKLPDDRVDLYQQCSRLLLHQWDVERTLGDFPGLSAEIGLREKTDILRTVAYAMQTGLGRLGPLSRPSEADQQDGRDNGPILQSNYIDGTTLTSLIEDYLHTELRFEQARAVARALVEQLRTRNFILCYLGAESYAFVHRTFLEYFCAADIVHQFNVAKTLSEQDLIALFDAHCRDDDWREVLRLICGQIDEQFVGRIVEHLATRTDLEKWDGKTPLPELPLAVYCLSEMRSLGPHDATGRSLLNVITTLATESTLDLDINDFLLNALLPACKELGTRWPGKETLAERALQQIDEIKMVGDLFWPQFLAVVLNDRKLLAELAVSKKEMHGQRAVSFGAGRAMKQVWPDNHTKQFFVVLVLEEEVAQVRAEVIRSLAEKWPDETTRELLAQRAVQAPDETRRGEACSALGKMHSEFGRILPTSDVDGTGPYLDPLEPIFRDHIEKAAKKAGVRAEDIDAQIASLSAHFGWDITVGAKK